MLLVTMQQAFDLTLQEFEEWFKAQNPKDYKPSVNECKGVFYNKLVKNLDSCNESHDFNQRTKARDVLNNDNIKVIDINEDGKVIRLLFEETSGSWHWPETKERYMRKLREVSMKSDLLNQGLSMSLENSINSIKGFKI